MSLISFENYGKLARKLSRDTEIIGRYPIQKEAARRIILDVVEKLEVQPTDSKKLRNTGKTVNILDGDV